MAKIKMSKTLPVAVDGVHISLFQQGEEYPVADKLAAMLVYKLKVATFVRERTMPEPSEKAVIEGAPEIKAEEKIEPESDEEIEEESEQEEVVIEDEPEAKTEIGDGQEEAIPEDPPMIRVHQLANELGISNRSILNKAQVLGIEATAPASGLSNEEVKRLKEALGFE